ncbi:protein bicaudal C homolog 1-like isoform X1 [Centruroides sculpturatus]|uniref:protein bicaudal C homolog 1-like isoform X1 n=1 Tax=Centruroides sculpturatus TaxID=218467 RepID=UPI000C6EC396|nr:protein bicaudal C homolog 1-like isoform X1 [Centruroides sculpturatus]XP_023215273.1 protein bicaudal C homolog 1-like isoform X1 [Centruroides sculpturatus]XP_023215274.1 protein bicaudal C homolog 1-like isoform X1 [Centruroides sculpturatus]
MVAINANHEAIVKELLTYGADIYSKSCNGESIYSLATKTGNIKIINLVDMFKNQRQLLGCNIHDGARISKQLVKQKQNTVMNRLLLSKEMNNATNLLSTSYQHSLSSLLERLDLSKYYHVFEDQDIDLDTFLTLTDKDLKDIGIKKLFENIMFGNAAVSSF